MTMASLSDDEKESFVWSFGNQQFFNAPSPLVPFSKSFSFSFTGH